MRLINNDPLTHLNINWSLTSFFPSQRSTTRLWASCLTRITTTRKTSRNPSSVTLTMTLSVSCYFIVGLQPTKTRAELDSSTVNIWNKYFTSITRSLLNRRVVCCVDSALYREVCIHFIKSTNFVVTYACMVLRTMLWGCWS